MRRLRLVSASGTAVTALVVVLTAVSSTAGVQPPAPVPLDEMTIRDLHSSLSNRTLTCRAIVQGYLRRIEAFDRNGPAINSIVFVNAAALETAAELDARAELSGLVGAMHCVPVIVKDNFETRDMPTTAGSLSLAGMSTGKDAFVVRRLREAGAIILAKANMHEFAFSQYETVSSILPGYTRNPYDLSRVTAGSSGGTAAAVAANLGAVGLGTDTGASIRGPAAHQALVGIRPTMGLTSRSGVVPVFLDSDVTGPLTRSVADAAAVLDVIAGYDPDDGATVSSRGRLPVRYTASLRADGLRGARIGVLRQAFASPTNDAEVMQLFETALSELRRAGADVIDPVTVERLDELRPRRGASFRCNPFKHDLNRYLSALGDKAPKQSLAEIIASGEFHPTIQRRLEASQSADDIPGETPGCRERSEFRQKLRDAVHALFERQQLDAVVYPTWSNPPRLIGDLNTPHGDNNQLFAPATGFPAITVPMGYTRGDRLPAGLQFLGPAWSEATLIRTAYSYEQATRHRRRAPSAPPLIHH